VTGKPLTKGPAVTGQTSIRKVGVIGAGQMGNGIAHVVAIAGYDVAVNDLKREAYDKAVATIEKKLA
jgi:3-hydroxybutyryl-CoA dehydrogenase